MTEDKDHLNNSSSISHCGTRTSMLSSDLNSITSLGDKKDLARETTDSTRSASMKN